MNHDPEGVSHFGADGVLRSLSGDRSTVLDYVRLSPAQISHLVKTPEDRAAMNGVDGRLVIIETELFTVPRDALEKRGPDMSAIKRSPVLMERGCPGSACSSSSQCTKISGCKSCLVNFTPGGSSQCISS